jgi:hypothetical protein
MRSCRPGFTANAMLLSAYVRIAYVRWFTMISALIPQAKGLSQAIGGAGTAMPDCFEIPRVVPPLLLFLNVKHLLSSTNIALMRGEVVKEKKNNPPYSGMPSDWETSSCLGT